MSFPELKREIVVERCPNPEALSIHVGSCRADVWVVSEGNKFNTSVLNLESKHTPYDTVVIVSRCYDIEEVKSYLESPVYKD